MCYSSNTFARPKTELNSSVAYPLNGYRSDCRNVYFNEIVFKNEATQALAYFKAEPGRKLRLSDTNYLIDGATYGTWLGSGAASTSYLFQMLMCDSATGLSPAFFMSGISSGCFKTCGFWCNDVSTQWFRTPGDTTSFAGDAFAENGHTNVGVKILSVGLRFVAPASTLGSSPSNPGTSCANIKSTVSTAPDGVYWIKPSGVTNAYIAYCE